MGVEAAALQHILEVSAQERVLHVLRLYDHPRQGRQETLFRLNQGETVCNIVLLAEIVGSAWDQFLVSWMASFPRLEGVHCRDVLTSWAR